MITSTAKNNPRNALWPAPAKLNLFLHITGQREDGYHLLQTLFIFLDQADQLSFEITQDPDISLAYQLEGVEQQSDLVYRAARALQRAAAVRQGAVISLEKHLPMGGGLGGGSSDAATTLLALNSLWDCGLSTLELCEIGLSLGADVPVFVHGRAAWAEGVGESLTPVEVPEAWYLVLIPKINVSTAQVFANPQLIRDCPPITIRDFLAGQGQNVCQPVVSLQYPLIAQALADLGQYGEARLTGTGACVFAAFADQASAQQAWSQLGQKWHGFVARGLNTSPVLAVLSDHT